MDIISAKVARRGVISLPTKVIQELNNQIMQGLESRHNLIRIYWENLGISINDDDTIGYALELLVDAGYEVLPFYTYEYEFGPSGALIYWDKDIELFIDEYLTDNGLHRE